MTRAPWADTCSTSELETGKVSLDQGIDLHIQMPPHGDLRGTDPASAGIEAEGRQAEDSRFSPEA